MRKSLLRTVGVFVATIMLCLGALPAYASDIEYYYPRSFKVGDTIYYDNSETGWDKVRIYFFNNYGGETYGWDERPEMILDENGMYKYEIPSMEDYCLEVAGEEDYQDCVDYYSYVYYYDYDTGEPWTEYDEYWDNVDHLVFSDEEGGGGEGKQTIDLSFIESGFIYKSTRIEQEWGNWRGYWYLYDKVELFDLLDAAKEYANKIECINEDEAKAFVNYVNEAEGVIDGVLRLHTDEDAVSGEYWIVIGEEVEEGQQVVALDDYVDSFTEAFESIKEKYGENPSLCKEDVNPDTFDSIGLYVGLGVASVIGLVVESSIRRRA